jgi:hypothetical protein
LIVKMTDFSKFCHSQIWTGTYNCEAMYPVKCKDRPLKLENRNKEVQDKHKELLGKAL